MHAFGLLLASGLALLAFATPTGAEDGKRADTVKWAKRIAQDFFVGTTDRPMAGLGLLTPELARSMEIEKYDLLNRLNWGYDGHLIKAEEVAPEGGEVVLSGVVQAKPGFSCRDATFMMHIVREAGGRWSIRFLSVKEHEAPKAR